MARCASMISPTDTPARSSCTARAAARADLDLHHALRLQGAQSIARDDAAHPEALGEILLGAEKIAGTKLLGEERIANLGDDLRRHGRGAEGNDLPLAVLHGRMQPHAKLRRWSGLLTESGRKRSNDHKYDIFSNAPSQSRNRRRQRRVLGRAATTSVVHRFFTRPQRGASVGDLVRPRRLATRVLSSRSPFGLPVARRRANA